MFLLVLTACQQKVQESSEAPPGVALFLKMEAALGEGPIWNHETDELYWVDIEGKFLHILDPASKDNRSWPTPSRIGTVVPINDTLAIVALQNGTYLIHTKTGDLTFHAAVDSSNAETRLNDGKSDPMGRLWVGSMQMPQDRPGGNLFMVEGNGNVTEKLDSITISNGIVWTADKKTMYYIDTPEGTIQAFDYENQTGELSNERTAVVIDEELGQPDGMAIDEEGKLWVGLWNGNSIVRFDPETGALLSQVQVPAHNVTACAFGGRDLDSLFITTARLDMTAEELETYPDAGSIFVYVPGVKGVKSDFFTIDSNL